jgi:hypothetical protein
LSEKWGGELVAFHPKKDLGETIIDEKRETLFFKRHYSKNPLLFFLPMMILLQRIIQQSYHIFTFFFPFLALVFFERFNSLQKVF